jgi:ABC-type lipoprotein release transport system permease subunit
MTRSRAATNPLAPLTYLRRNAGKTIPLTVVIVMAVMLVSGIISMINSIPLSIRTIYAYSKKFTGVTPRGDATRTQVILNEIKAKSPVAIDRVITCRTAGTVVQSIVGKWPFFILGLSPDDMTYYLRLQNATDIDGRLPKPGAAEAVVSEPVARNLNLKIGSNLLGPKLDDGFSPNNVKVVGIAKTDQWVMVVPIEYLRAYHFPPVDLGIVVAKNPAEQDRLDRWADKHFKGQRAAILAYFQIEKNTDEMFRTLYQILNVVIGTLVIVITFMMGMLINIYQSQRIVEFGLLQAIGYTKRQILSRVLTETAMVVVVGWLFGLLAAYGLLNVANATLMAPRAYAINPVDKVAYLYSLPMPIAILVVAAATITVRFKNFDPIGVVERRIV